MTGSSVLVVGSGAAGLAAALAAAGAGADVALVERDTVIGGTTALSGGVVWAPGNHLAGLGERDAADALAYLEAVAPGAGADPRSVAVTADAGRVTQAVEERTRLRWELLTDWPDYHVEAPGATVGRRSLWPAPLGVPASLAEMIQRPPGHTDRLGERHDEVTLAGAVRGRTLIAGLAAAALDAGVEIRRRARATALVAGADGVHGLVLDDEVLAGRVVLASGGFQHDRRLAEAFLPGGPVDPLGTPGCVGDGLRMAMRVGAGLDNMPEGWWTPAMHAEGETLGGRPFFRPLHSERGKPGAIMVDRSGRRFCNEAQNYGDVGRAMHRFSANGTRYPASPCWLVFDAGYRARYPVGPLGPDDPDPEWVRRADLPAALAAAIGADAGVLTATFERYNAGAAAGSDPDFGRGDHAYDRWIGDPEAPHPTLRPLAPGALYAVEVRNGCMGTKGGPCTDDRGRVLSVDGRRIAGLYAAGNAAASSLRTATPAGGATLGPALVMGWRAGEAAAQDR